MTEQDSDEKRKDKERVHLYVSGMVQGVFFRARTRDVAQSLGLTGWVRNLSDGRVEIVAEGLHDGLVRLISWCHKGPRAASVEHVEIKWQKASGEYDTFSY